MSTWGATSSGFAPIPHVLNCSSSMEINSHQAELDRTIFCNGMFVSFLLLTSGEKDKLHSGASRAVFPSTRANHSVSINSGMCMFHTN